METLNLQERNKIKKDENTGGLFKKNKKTKGSINTRL